MSSSRRKFHMKHPVIVDIGCSCRRLKISSFLFPFSKNQTKPHNKFHTNFSPSTSTSLTTTTTVTHTNSTFSPSVTASSPSPKQSMVKRRRKTKKKRMGVVEESVAVEKDSCDPCFDFRDSMLQMIIEKEIYSWVSLGSCCICSCPSTPLAITQSFIRPLQRS